MKQVYNLKHHTGEWVAIETFADRMAQTGFSTRWQKVSVASHYYGRTSYEFKRQTLVVDKQHSKTPYATYDFSIPPKHEKGDTVLIKGNEYVVEGVREAGRRGEHSYLLDGIWTKESHIECATTRQIKYRFLTDDCKVEKRKINLPSHLRMKAKIEEYIAHVLSVDIERIEI